MVSRFPLILSVIPGFAPAKNLHCFRMQFEIVTSLQPLTSLKLNDGWKTTFLLGFCNFSGAIFLTLGVYFSDASPLP